VTADTRPFWIDWDYDQANADLGTRSRYGNYLHQADRSFAEIWADDPTVEFARIAWRVATGPVMAPPLVRRHRRITSVALDRSDWNGELVADVSLISPRPAVLADTRTPDGGWYRDFQIGAWDVYDSIGEDDLTRNAYMLTEVRMLWQFPPGTLPAVERVPAGGDARFRLAVECLDVLVLVLNRNVGPVIEQLEES
jgi:hypothetical protein